jgi:RNA polymerase sigma factor (sigma-70 family)
METTTLLGSWHPGTTPDSDSGPLMEAFLRKDNSAAAELYRRFARRIFGIGMVILRNRAQAEDLVQDTFVNLWRKGMAFDASRMSLDTWVTLTALGLAIDRRRSTDTRLLASLCDVSDSGATTVMGTLPSPQRRAVERTCLSPNTSRKITDEESLARPPQMNGRPLTSIERRRVE